MPEQVARLASDDEAAQARAKGLKAYAGEMGAVLLRPQGLELPETLTLGLRSFLGIKDITVQGLQQRLV